MRRVRKFHLILFFAALAFFQALPCWNRLFGRFKPDMLLDATLFFGLFYGRNLGLLSGIISGVFKDSFSGAYVLSNVFSLGVVGYISGVYKNKLFVHNPLVQILAAFAAGIAAFFFFYLFAQIFVEMPQMRASFFCAALPGAIVSAMASPAIFFVLKKIY